MFELVVIVVDSAGFIGFKNASPNSVTFNHWAVGSIPTLPGQRVRIGSSQSGSDDS